MNDIKDMLDEYKSNTDKLVSDTLDSLNSMNSNKHDKNISVSAGVSKKKGIELGVSIKV